MSEWSKVLPGLADRAYRAIATMPESLLMEPHHPGISGDLNYARLIGHDDQVVADLMRVKPFTEVIYQPVHQRITVMTYTDPAVPELRRRRFDCMNVYSALSINPTLYGCQDCPAMPGPPDFLVKVCFLIYRFSGIE